MQQYEVFKAVTPTSDPEKFLSFYDKSMFCLSYCIGVTTRPVAGTLLFVFDSYENAQIYEGFYGTKILRGYSTCEPQKSPLEDKVLDTDFLNNLNEVQIFWTDINKVINKEMTLEAFRDKHNHDLQHVPDGTLYVPDFTPTAVIECPKYY